MIVQQNLVSVIMPAYNAGRYIRDSIRSVLNQTYSNWELLVINDGSTDNTGEIIQSFADPRIRYFEKENGGVSSARNKGLTEMRGAFFCFLDADDCLPPASIAVRVRFMQANPEVDMMGGSVQVGNASLKKIIRMFRPTFSGNPAREYIRLNDHVFFGPILFFRNQNIDYRFAEEMTHAEDLWFYTELAWNRNLKYDHVKEVIYQYRKTPDSSMSNLKGLEKGYWQYYHHVKNLPGITAKQLSYLRKKIVIIMIRCYLKKRNLISVIKITGKLFSQL